MRFPEMCLNADPPGRIGRESRAAEIRPASCGVDHARRFPFSLVGSQAEGASTVRDLVDCRLLPAVAELLRGLPESCVEREAGDA